MKTFDGIQIGQVLNSSFQKNLYKKHYCYSIVNLKKNKSYNVNYPNIGSLVVLYYKKKNSIITINNKDYNVSKFKFFNFNVQKINKSSTSNIKIGIAGIKKTLKKNVISPLKEKNIYKVIKPWGYELWINGQEPTYSFKKIFIKKGTRTSLQFHKKKVETNFLFDGVAQLSLSKKSGKYSSNEILKNIYNKKISSGTFMNVKNFAIHRIEAISDILLFEVSTPHLDDVIRLFNDNKRKDGKILKEHLSNKKL